MTNTQQPLRLALITSGFDHLTAGFHQWPEKPSLIIELNEWDAKLRAKYFVRKLLRIVFPSKYPDCEAYCLKHRLQYQRVRKSKKAELKTVLQAADVSLVVSYRCAIIPMEALESVPHGGINLHGSLLPNFRGGNPLFWQVLHNEEHAGCTVHRLSAGIDEGDILEQTSIKRPRFIHHEDLAYQVNVELGQPLLASAIQNIAAGTAVSKTQKPADEFDQPTHPAPNCDWGNWQSLLPVEKLSEDHERDIQCFLGHGASATLKPPVI